MSAARRLGALIGALAALVAGAAAVPPVAGAGHKPPTSIGIRGQEFSLTFTSGRSRFAPGPARIQFQNYGEDAHDLKIRVLGADENDVIADTGVVESHENASFDITRLKPKTKYYLWCSLLDGAHEASGMHAALSVKKRRH